MKTYKSAVGIRGDMLYCPLCFYIDSYWTCEPNCAHCFARRLNRTWGNDFRAADVDDVKKKLLSRKGTSPLHRAIQQRKTLRLGNRADPFQDCELEYKVSTRILKFLREQNWDTVIQTKFPHRAYGLTGLGENVIMLAEISPGLEADWELFEGKRTENPIKRIRTLERLKKKGFRIGANGEPFIPGYHTLKQFRETIRFLKSHGITGYNTYNLHMNDHVVKNLFHLGLDIERIYNMNQDAEWKKILRRLITIADEYGITLGCPDFVNSTWSNIQKSNTCCGIDVKNPCTYNSHYFKLAVQQGRDPRECWDGVGEYEEGLRVIDGTTKEMYTLKDIIKNPGEGGKNEKKKDKLHPIVFPLE
ncbi:MAG: hypothetical protein BWX44_00069 [Spirochaetes bacterium ADurb.Bin001]|nr:MAG: hypothetical protein BWX44_00069 [Spirochaetes bacterium ADurb.Bin001]